MKFRVLVMVFSIVTMLLIPASALAVSTTPTIDGTIQDSEWSPGSDNANCGHTSTLNNVDLYVTWDSDYLYIGFNESDLSNNYVLNDNIAVFLDTTDGGARYNPFNMRNIADPGVGYEHAFVIYGGADDHYSAVGSDWFGPDFPPAGYTRAQYIDSYPYGLEIQIPRTEVGLGTDGSKVGLMVQMLSGGNWEPLGVWPDVPGNNQTGDVTQAYKLTLNNNDIWICAATPTAISLTDLRANAFTPTGQPVFGLAILSLLVAAIGVGLLHRHRQNS